MSNSANTITLNSSQEEGYSKILAFLLSDDKYFILSGGPGTGKSTLINYMSDNLLEEYSKYAQVLGSKYLQNQLTITATTNSAADSLKQTINTSQVTTIHSSLGLIVNNGQLKMMRQPTHLSNSILVIDEYTLIDNALFKFIDEYAKKVILVGDADQLLAVKGLAPALKRKDPDHVLDIPERTKSPDILKVVNTFRDYVHEIPDPDPIDLTGMVDVEAITEEDFISLVTDPTMSFADSRILTHTNAEVIAINQAIRQARGLPEHFIAGERVILNKYVRRGNLNFKTDSEYIILNHKEDDLNDEFLVDYYKWYTIQDSWGGIYTVPYGVIECNSPAHPELFDLRSLYCSTVYKAQGRSVDTVYLHLSGFPSNVTRSVLMRSLYVGASRARKKLVFVGDLPPTLLGKI